MSSTVIDGNSASSGGGINVGSTTDITDSTISDNSADFTGMGGFGGGIQVDEEGSVLTLTDSTVSGNTSVYGGGGIAVFGLATLIESTIADNTAAYAGRRALQ